MSELEMATAPVEIRHLNGGTQALFRFPNDYGASVISGPYSYGGTVGLWELAVIKWSGSTFQLTYDTAITDDVVGHLEASEVDELLTRVRQLDTNGTEAAAGAEVTA